MSKEERDNLPPLSIRGMQQQLLFFREELWRVELDFRNFMRSVTVDTKTEMKILLLIKEIDSLRNEVRWMIGIMITILISLMASAITITLALLQ